LKHLPDIANAGAAKLTRAFRRRLRGSAAVLSEGLDAAERDDLMNDLAALLAASLTVDERRRPDAIVQDLEVWANGRATAMPDILGTHGGWPRRLLRTALRSLSRNATFFDRATPAADDLAIIKAHLPEGCGPCVAVAGHTHAAREVFLSNDRVYLNTGTWTDLMSLPPAGDDKAAQLWVEALKRGEIGRIRRLTYAEVTVEGPKLLEWDAHAA
jgi:hypothetical protein